MNRYLHSRNRQTPTTLCCVGRITQQTRVAESADFGSFVRGFALSTVYSMATFCVAWSAAAMASRSTSRPIGRVCRPAIGGTSGGLRTPYRAAPFLGGSSRPPVCRPLPCTASVWSLAPMEPSALSDAYPRGVPVARHRSHFESRTGLRARGPDTSISRRRGPPTATFQSLAVLFSRHTSVHRAY